MGDVVDIQDLSTEDIIAADDSELVREEVPEWKKNGKPGFVYLRVMSAEDALNFGKRMQDPAKKDNALMDLMSYCMCNSKGDALIPRDRVDQFKKKSIKVYMRLQKRALVLNGFDKPDVELAKAKNDSGEAPSGDSPTDSQ